MIIAYIFNSRLMSGTEGKSMCKNTYAPTNHTVEAKEKLYKFILIAILHGAGGTSSLNINYSSNEMRGTAWKEGCRRSNYTTVQKKRAARNGKNVDAQGTLQFKWNVRHDVGGPSSLKVHYSSNKIGGTSLFKVHYNSNEMHGMSWKRSCRTKYTTVRMKCAARRGWKVVALGTLQLK